MTVSEGKREVDREKEVVEYERFRRKSVGWKARRSQLQQKVPLGTFGWAHVSGTGTQGGLKQHEIFGKYTA
jgi:hypothetical protein